VCRDQKLLTQITQENQLDFAAQQQRARQTSQKVTCSVIAPLPTARTDLRFSVSQTLRFSKCCLQAIRKRALVQRCSSGCDQEGFIVNKAERVTRCSLSRRLGRNHFLPFLVDGGMTLGVKWHLSFSESLFQKSSNDTHLTQQGRICTTRRCNCSRFVVVEAYFLR